MYWQREKKMDRYKLKEAAYTLVNKMLDPSDGNNLKIVYIDKHGIFSIDENDEVVETIVDTSSMLDTEYLNVELKNINRVKLVGDTYRTIKIISGYLERIDKSWQNTGSYIKLVVEELRVIGDNGEILMDNISKNSTTANDMAVALLQLCGYTQGYVNMVEQTIYGTDSSGNNKFLGSFDLSWFEGAKKLTFDELGMGHSISKNPGDTIRYIKLPYRYHKDISRNLERALEDNGIILVQNMIANNMIDSIIKLKEDRSNQVNFIYIGSGFPTMSSSIGNVQNYKRNYADLKIALESTNNNIILDPQNLLTIDQVNEISESNIVIVNTLDKTLLDFYKKFDAMEDTSKKSFTSRLKYFGNPEEQGNDIFIDELKRDLLRLNEYDLVDTMIRSYSSIYSIIYTLLYKAKGVTRIYNTGNCVSLECINNGKVEYNRLSNIKFTNSHIIELLVNNLDVEVDQAIKILKSKEDYTGMMRIVVGSDVILLRVNMVKSSLGIPSVYFSVIPRKDDRYRISDLWDNTLNFIIGKRGSGKTDKVRASIPSNENIYIFDSDYEFSELESEDYGCKSMIIEREVPDINMIRQVNPSIVIINSTIDIDSLLPIMTLANRGMKVVICMTVVNYSQIKNDNKYTTLINDYELSPQIFL